MKIDLHGYHPKDLDLTGLIEQVWQTGADSVTLIHGHGRTRGRRVRGRTRTGYFGVRIRRALRHDPTLKPFIVRSSLECIRWGQTYIRIRKNPKPSRAAVDMSLIGLQRYAHEVKGR